MAKSSNKTKQVKVVREKSGLAQVMDSFYEGRAKVKAAKQGQYRSGIPLDRTPDIKDTADSGLIRGAIKKNMNK